MKELRVSKGGALRVLVAFDPRRHAILLLGGDKSGRWQEWRNWAIPPGPTTSTTPISRNCEQKGFSTMSRSHDTTHERTTAPCPTPHRTGSSSRPGCRAVRRRRSPRRSPPGHPRGDRPVRTAALSWALPGRPRRRAGHQPTGRLATRTRRGRQGLNAAQLPRQPRRPTPDPRHLRRRRSRNRHPNPDPEPAPSRWV